MEYMLDTANLEQVSQCLACFPIAGVTTNPTILKEEGKIALRERLLALRRLCGSERSLHVQLLARKCEVMLMEAEAVYDLLGENTYVKIPVTEEGLKAIAILKRQGKPVTATAVYYLSQALLAVAAGAEYVAPYCNRMENNDIDFRRVIESTRTLIDRDGYATKIVAASFKNSAQVNDALVSGAHAVTLAPSLLRTTLVSPLVESAVLGFENDFLLYHPQGLLTALQIS
jgi:transaldolase